MLKNSSTSAKHGDTLQGISNINQNLMPFWLAICFVWHSAWCVKVFSQILDVFIASKDSSDTLVIYLLRFTFSLISEDFQWQFCVKSWDSSAIAKHGDLL